MQHLAIDLIGLIGQSMAKVNPRSDETLCKQRELAHLLGIPQRLRGLCPGLHGLLPSLPWSRRSKGCPSVPNFAKASPHSQILGNTPPAVLGTWVCGFEEALLRCKWDLAPGHILPSISDQSNTESFQTRRRGGQNSSSFLCLLWLPKSQRFNEEVLWLLNQAVSQYHSITHQ